MAEKNSTTPKYKCKSSEVLFLVLEIRSFGGHHLEVLKYLILPNEIRAI